MAGFKVFLSAASNEFASARDALANDLQAHDVTVRIQRSFRHDGTPGVTLLRQLHDYIAECDVVVCLIGSRSGAGFPQPDEATAFAAALPDGIAAASYTQWEFFFARRLAKRCLVFVAGPRFRRDRRTASPDDRPDLQVAFTAHVQSFGEPWVPVDSRHEFRAEALKRLLQAAPPPALATRIEHTLGGPLFQPLVLPYPSLGPLFIGRDDALDRLRASLTRSGGTATAIRAVAGMGGVGKSRLAVEYAWAHRDDHTALLWLEAETADRQDAGLAALTTPLRLPEQAATDASAQKEATLAWLNVHPGWLLILDNVDSEPALAAAHRLLGRLRGGHVILTSRLTGFPLGMRTLDLDVLAPDAAATLLLAASADGRRAAPDDDAQAAALALDLGHLALALTMAAATIRQKRLSFAQYRALWQGNRARVIGWAGSALPDYHHALAETWQTSVAQLTPAGRRLLERLAFLAPDPVPMALLDVPVRGVEAEDAAAALDDLAAYSLVTREKDGEGFSVHRLVQEVTRLGLEVEGTARGRLEEALGWVSVGFRGDPDNVRSWPALDPLVRHSEAVALQAEKAGIAVPTAQLQSVLGVLFLAKAQYALSEPLLRCALMNFESSFGPHHQIVAKSLNNLAMLLKSTSRFVEAEPLMRRALAITVSHLGQDHPDVAIRLNNLALLLQATNRLAEAEPLMRRALAIDETSLGQDHPSVATDLNNLAALLQATNRFAETEPLLRRALAIDEANLGQDHPNVASDLNNLAMMLQETNRPAEAEPLLLRALAIDEARLGQDHPAVARDLNNLGQLLKAAGRLAEAEPLMRRALAIDEASLGPDHPDVARDLNNLAMLLQVTNRPTEAEPLIRRALAVSEASLGQRHPTVAIRLNNLALLLQATNRLAEAEPLLRRALAIFLAFQRDTGHAHPGCDRATDNYHRLLAAMGHSEADIREAIQALVREAGLDQA